jgi:hypothetical protein
MCLMGHHGFHFFRVDGASIQGFWFPYNTSVFPTYCLPVAVAVALAGLCLFGRLSQDASRRTPLAGRLSQDASRRTPLAGRLSHFVAGASYTRGATVWLRLLRRVAYYCPPLDILAYNLNLPLWTLDKRQANLAGMCGVPVVALALLEA